ncbi:DUF262 domain-containing protein [Streptomyces badius]
MPEYQRPYRWQPEQAQQLLADLEVALLRGDREPCFLGSLVLVKDSRTAEADVIDGQQHLPTLAILPTVLHASHLVRPDITPTVTAEATSPEERQPDLAVRIVAIRVHQTPLRQPRG